MRVLLVNTSERIGGAAVAASRLMQALNRHGVKAKLLVRDKQTDSLSVVPLPRNWRLRWHFLWERMVIWVNRRLQRQGLFEVDIANAGTDITTLPEFREADIIHLHWINQGMLSIGDIRRILASGKPVVWTMHDMWPCTAICHHARQCEHYHTECHDCPYLSRGAGRHDLSTRLFRRKRQLLQGRRVHFVACSRWLQQQASLSALLQGQPLSVIPNPLDTRLFAPGPKAEARTRLSLPHDRRLLLFGSVKTTDPRKGVDYLVEACRLLARDYPEWSQCLGIVVAGSHSEALQGLFPFPVYPLPFTTSEARMADIYRAADLFVTPSLEENLPNTLMESMACGTPCVGFHVGGIPEMIDHEANGYVARYRDAADLAAGIYRVLTHPDYEGLCTRAVHKAVSHYSEDVVARRFIELYQSVSHSSC